MLQLNVYYLKPVQILKFKVFNNILFRKPNQMGCTLMRSWTHWCKLRQWLVQLNFLFCATLFLLSYLYSLKRGCHWSIMIPIPDSHKCPLPVVACLPLPLLLLIKTGLIQPIQGSGLWHGIMRSCTAWVIGVLFEPHLFKTDMPVGF